MPKLVKQKRVWMFAFEYMQVCLKYSNDWIGREDRLQYIEKLDQVYLQDKNTSVYIVFEDFSLILRLPKNISHFWYTTNFSIENYRNLELLYTTGRCPGHFCAKRCKPIRGQWKINEDHMRKLDIPNCKVWMICWKKYLVILLQNTPF